MNIGRFIRRITKLCSANFDSSKQLDLTFARTVSTAFVLVKINFLQFFLFLFRAIQLSPREKREFLFFPLDLNVPLAASH